MTNPYTAVDIKKDVFDKLCGLSHKLGVSRTRLLHEAVAEYLSKRGLEIDYSADRDAPVLGKPEKTRKWTKNMKDLFVATWIDTEGSVGFAKVRHKNVSSGFQYRPFLSISNTNETPLLIIQKLIGGYVFEQKRRYKGKPRYSWTWACRMEKIPVILKRIFPYLMIKKEQTRLLLDYFTRFPERHGAITKERLRYSEELHQRVHRLNQGRGHHGSFIQ